MYIYANNVKALYKPFCDYCQKYLRTGGYMMDQVPSNLYVRSENEMNLYALSLTSNPYLQSYSVGY
jgi:hypothetical protein